MAPRLGRNESALPPRRSLRIREKKMKSSAAAHTQTLPHELISEILCFLPPKPLASFKCVSKLWRESIEGHSFTQKHSTNIGRHYIRKGNRNIQRNEDYFEILCGSNGLILERSKLTSKYRVRNPFTKHVLDLPDPMEQHMFPAMVYAHAEKKYKLFSLYKKVSEGTIAGGFKILTLEETDLTWRNVDIPELRDGITEKTSILKGNVFFALTADYNKIVCVDVESEGFSVVDNIPKAFNTAAAAGGSVSVITWNNKFAIVIMDRNGAGEWKIYVWILEDYKKHIWAPSKASVNLSFINQHFPEFKEIKFMFFKENTLWLSVDSPDNRHFVGYNITDKNPKPVIVNITHVCRRVIFCYYSPSLAYLKGMKAEDGDISDYEIIPFPHFW